MSPAMRQTQVNPRLEHERLANIFRDYFGTMAPKRGGYFLFVLISGLSRGLARSEKPFTYQRAGSGAVW
jgi:hypothetical protein